MNKTTTLAILTGFLGLAVSQAFVQPAQAQDDVLHVYSSRHYDVDQALYNDFTAQTGIAVEVIEGKDDALQARLVEEAAQSPADVLVTVDAGRLWRAEEAGLLEPVQSDILEARIPANLRDPNGAWYGFSTRARVIAYDKNAIDPAQITSYADLADPQWKEQVCIRSASNIYNLSLMASMISTQGEDAATTWAQGVLDNLARKPQGGDTDQIRAVAAGVCDLALANSYYYARLARSDKAEDQAVVEKVGLIFPQDGGTHVNISGAAVLKASDNKQAALKFLEYLSSDEAQAYFSDGNNEYPVVEGVEMNATLRELGEFTPQDINVREYGVHQRAAQQAFDRIAFP